MGRDSVTSLAPGFRFHPTDEELVRYYLKRKVCNKPFRFDAISVFDVYKSEPWDLPDKSKLKSRDLEWYFFTVLDKKYGNGSKTNRATEKGYWKTTGKDREIRCSSRTVGMKKTLVYHKGRAPRGERTNWVMHEYRLVDEELLKAGVVQDAFVLCRIFQKSGSGPKNGEKYGAPFIGDEWEDDGLAFVPAQDGFAEGMAASEDVYVDVDEFDQKPDTLLVRENNPVPLNFDHGKSSNNDSGDYVESSNYISSGNYIESGGYFEQSRYLAEEDQMRIIGTGGMQCGSVLLEDRVAYGLPGQTLENVESFDDEVAAEMSCNAYLNGTNYLLDEPYVNATDDLQFNDGLYLEGDDLCKTAEADGFNIEDYLTYFDEDDLDARHLSLNTSELENVNFISEQEGPTQKPVPEESEEGSMASKNTLEEQNKNEASASNQDPEAKKFESDSKVPFLKKASYMMGAIPAPPPFVSEFPTKNAAIRLHSAAQSSASVNLTASMIRISYITLAGGGGMDWSYSKNGNMNLVLSFGLVQGGVRSASKTGSGISWGLFMMLFWVLILSISFKIGTCICTR